MGTELLDLDDAQQRVIGHAHPLRPEHVLLEHAGGRVLARDVTASIPLPRFDHSTMDGYAIVATDQSSWSLPVAFEVSAGSSPQELMPDTACRIFTGAPLPRFATAVVPQEHVRREGNVIHGSRLVFPGAFVRKTGEDVEPGSQVLRRGVRLLPGALSLLAMLDETRVFVHRAPRVAILCTGNEIRLAGTMGTPFQVPESVSIGVLALALQARASAFVLPKVSDERHATARALDLALAQSDLVVTVGGVSVGDHDHVRGALDDVGARLEFWKVAIKPGKQIAFGYKDNALFLGLPGNPASALVTFALFGMPLLRALQGDRTPFASRMSGHLEHAHPRTLERDEIARACFRWDNGKLYAKIHRQQASGAATSLAQSDGVVIVPRGEGEMAEGARCDAIRWIDF